jgi:hypothetical protein
LQIGESILCLFSVSVSLQMIDLSMVRCPQHGPSHIRVVLVGNKAETAMELEERCKNDVAPKRQITFAEGATLADELGIPFIETSAKYDVQVDEAFELLLSSVDVGGGSVSKHSLDSLMQRSSSTEYSSVSGSRKSSSSHSKAKSEASFGCFGRQSKQRPSMEDIREPLLTTMTNTNAPSATEMIVRFNRKSTNDINAIHKMPTYLELMELLFPESTVADGVDSAEDPLTNIVIENGAFHFPFFIMLLPVLDSSKPNALPTQSSARCRQLSLSTINFVRNSFRMYFVCAHTLQVSLGREPLVITRTNDWIKSAASYLMAGMALARVGMEISGLPLPNPDLVGNDDWHVHAKFLDAVMAYIQSVADSDDNIVAKISSEQWFDMNSVEACEPVPIVQSWRHMSSMAHQSAQKSISELFVSQQMRPSDTGLRRCVSNAGVIQWIWDNDHVEHSFVHCPSRVSMSALNTVIEAYELHWNGRDNKQGSSSENPNSSSSSCCGCCC